MPALLLRNVTRRYASHVAVRDLSLTVPHGTIYGILGPNGAGKSTTLRMVMNIIARDSGEIRVLGEAPDSGAILRRVGYLPEERGLYRAMTVLDVIVFFGRLKGLDRARSRREADAWLERMGLADWRGSRVDALSKGMQQKVQFITTVIHEPDLLILDEPQSGLDPVNQEVLRETIIAVRDAGGTVVLSTHNMDQAEALCDAVCIIAGGRKVLDGGVREMRRAHRGHRYRLRVDPDSTAEMLHALEAMLRRATDQVEHSADRTRWELELRNGGSRELLAALAGLPLEVESFERIEPSLHEIFISQVGAGARTAQRSDRDDA